MSSGSVPKYKNSRRFIIVSALVIVAAVNILIWGLFRQQSEVKHLVGLATDNPGVMLLDLSSEKTLDKWLEYQDPATFTQGFSLSNYGSLVPWPGIKLPELSDAIVGSIERFPILPDTRRANLLAPAQDSAIRTLFPYDGAGRPILWRYRLAERRFPELVVLQGQVTTKPDLTLATQAARKGQLLSSRVRVEPSGTLEGEWRCIVESKPATADGRETARLLRAAFLRNPESGEILIRWQNDSESGRNYR